MTRRHTPEERTLWWLGTFFDHVRALVLRAISSAHGRSSAVRTAGSKAGTKGMNRSVRFSYPVVSHFVEIVKPCRLSTLCLETNRTTRTANWLIYQSTALRPEVAQKTSCLEQERRPLIPVTFKTPPKKVRTATSKMTSTILEMYQRLTQYHFRHSQQLSLSTPWRYKGGERGTAPLILNLGAGWRWVVNLTTRIALPPEKNPGPSV